MEEMEVFNVYEYTTRCRGPSARGERPAAPRRLRLQTRSTGRIACFIFPTLLDDEQGGDINGVDSVLGWTGRTRIHVTNGDRGLVMREMW